MTVMIHSRSAGPSRANCATRWVVVRWPAGNEHREHRGDARSGKERIASGVAPAGGDGDRSAAHDDDVRAALEGSRAHGMYRTLVVTSERSVEYVELALHAATLDVEVFSVGPAT